MKISFFGAVAAFIISLMSILAQQDERDTQYELELHLKNGQDSNYYTLKVQSVGSVWSRCVDGYPLVDTLTGGAKLSNEENFSIMLTHIQDGTNENQICFGYGKYRISVLQDDSELVYCYIDYTTGNYPYGSGSCYTSYSADNDVFFYFYADSALFKIAYNGVYSVISNGATFSIWGLSGIVRDSACFWPNVSVSGQST